MVCDECLANPKGSSSPKRKQPNGPGNMVQSKIEVQNSAFVLSKSTPVLATPLKNTTVKQNQQFQTVVDALVQKIDAQTNTIAGLQVSVDTMKGAVQQNTVAIVKSIKETRVTYADIAKKGITSNVTPRSTNVVQTPKMTKLVQTPKTTKPVVTGTSTKVIGKPLSPPQRKRSDRPKPEKAVWLSRIHRDTTEEELANYIKGTIGIAPADFEVKKLVKKGRDIASYSFVSFCIACTEANFNSLMNPTYWPSNSQIREFELEQHTSTGVKLDLTSKQMQVQNGQETPKNLQEPPNENMLPEQPAMDTAQVTP